MFKKVCMAIVFMAFVAIPVQVQADTVVGPFSLSQTSFEFYYSIGGGLPTSQSMTFQNITDASIFYTLGVSSKPSWLNASYNESGSVATPGTPSGLGAAVNVDGLAVGKYQVLLTLSGDFASSPVTIPINLHVSAAGTALPANTTHPDMTNVVTPDGTVYRIQIGTRQPYTSAGAFLSYSYNRWEDVKPANAADLALPTGTCQSSETAPSRPCYITPRYGSLINDNGTVYLITDNHRIGFATSQAFYELGYSFSNVTPGDTSFLETLAPINTGQMAHPSGTAINIDGTICIVQSVFQSGGKAGYRCISKLQHFYDWGYRLSEVVMANSYDRALSLNGVIDYSPGPYNPMNL